MYQTLSDVKRAHRGHWFDSQAMRFFQTRFPDGETIYGGRFFITSEQFIGANGHKEPRAYSIRSVDEHGAIDTVGAFNSHKTLAAARKEARRLAGSLREVIRRVGPQAAADFDAGKEVEICPGFSVIKV